MMHGTTSLKFKENYIV